MDIIQCVDCYTDASYAKEIGGSVISYQIGNLPICTIFLENIKNTEAEIKAVDACIKSVLEIYPIENTNIQIHIHTDCQKVIALSIKGNYADNIIFSKMEGHVKKSIRNDKQMIFSKVDRAARKELRRRLKIVRNTAQI